jgi:CRISPR-associated protein Cas2
MLVLITYDVNTETAEGRRHLRHIAHHCQNYGQRVQKECLVDPAQWTALRQFLVDEIEPKTDSLRLYFPGKNWNNRVEHVGAHPGYDPQGPLVA